MKEFHLLSLFNSDQIREFVLCSIKTENYNKALFYIGFDKQAGINLEVFFFVIWRNY